MGSGGVELWTVFSGSGSWTGLILREAVMLWARWTCGLLERQARYGHNECAYQAVLINLTGTQTHRRVWLYLLLANITVFR